MVNFKVATWNISGINSKPFEFENKKDYPKFFKHVESFGNKGESTGDTLIISIMPSEIIKEIINNSTSKNLLDSGISDYFNYYKIKENIRGISGIERFLGDRPTILNAGQTIDGDYWNNLIAFLNDHQNKGTPLTPNEIAVMLLYEVVVYHIITTYDEWENVRSGIDRSKNRNEQIQKYINLVNADIMFLQEANANDLNMKIEGKILVTASNPANQTSCILISNTFSNIYYISEECVELAKKKIEAINTADPKKSVIKFNSQDLVVVTAEKENIKYILASFHGDSTGAATNAVVDAVCEIKNTKYNDHNLIFGLDANSSGDALSYSTFYHNLRKDDNNIIANVPYFGMESENKQNYEEEYVSKNWTTYKTRTLLQTQIYKAGKTDKSVKDYILVDNKNRLRDSSRINSIDDKNILKYDETQIPNNMFPADHLIVSSLFDLTETETVNPDTNSTKLLAGFAFIPFLYKYRVDIVMGLCVFLFLCFVLCGIIGVVKEIKNTPNTNIDPTIVHTLDI
jgi:hypothetical protein